MNNQLTTTDNTELVTKKATAWQAFGHKAALNEIAIAHNVGVALNNYTLPTDPEKLQQYDAERAVLRKLLSDTEDEIKKDTYITDAWKKRRREPLVLIEGFIANYEAALLPLKQKAKAVQGAADAKGMALMRLQTAYIKQYAELVATATQTVNEKIADLYIRAISKPEIEAITPEMMAWMSGQLDENSFKLNPITSANPDEQAIIDEVFGQYNPQGYVDMYHEQLLHKFATFAHDKKFAKESIDQTKYETQIQAQEVEADKELAVAAGSLSSMVDAPLGATHKALKEVYELAMTEEANSMIAIDKAFIVLDGYNKMSRIKSLFNITMKQKAEYIGKCKSGDNGLSIQGINFKKVEKL